MSGCAARTGFHYQDLYLLFRVLQNASESLDAAWQNCIPDIHKILDRNGIRYGIEASPRIDATNPQQTLGPDWDVLVLASGKLEFAEVKSGTLSKEDRLAFWKRLRRELGSKSEESTDVVPVLVVDPNAAGDLTKWQNLAATAAQFSGLPPSAEPTSNVLTAVQLLDEALWCLCHSDSSKRGDDPPVTSAVAQKTLSQFELHEHEAQQLDSRVFQLIELLFPGGLAHTEETLLLGWLNKRAAAPIQERRLFTISELLAEIGVLKLATSLTAETLKEWRDLWNEVPQGVIARKHLQLGEAGESVPAEKVQPSALEALTNGKNRSFVILGPGGAGKSTFVAQAAHNATKRHDLVFHCAADDVTPAELEKLVKAIRFRAVLAMTNSPNVLVCIFVDGLDEAEPALRKRWGQLLVRLTALPNIFLIASVREAVWNADGELRKELESWPNLTLTLWPEEVVRDLLTPTPYAEELPRSVISLLRTPILLDLFWRTFVEREEPDVTVAAKLQTRQNLLAAYWDQRLVQSPRYASIRDLPSRLSGVFSELAGRIGPFLETGLDAEIKDVLLSEGVFVREGRLQPRLRFRHPLLRDFAFAQWCLATDNAAEVANRWNSIQGGLQQYGALRALFEALSSPDARREYPRLELAAVLQTIVRTGENLARQLAQVLGTHEPSAGLDPASWPVEVQSSLPATFGCELLSAARLAGNGSWAAPLERWPDNNSWSSNGFAHEVWNYLSTLSEMLKSTPADRELREQCQQAARKLRRISELERFALEFSKWERWLKMQAMLCVIPILPDEATLSWVEREMLSPSWRTRSYVLERLIYLAPVNADRTVAIYRQAVGLVKTNGQHKLISPWQGGTFDHHAINWSLAGEDGRRGLLREHPHAFLPVALELAEALWYARHENENSTSNRIHELMKEFDPSWTDEAASADERQLQELLQGLIDDSPEWSYWQSFPDHDIRARCLGAIHECAEGCAKDSLDRFVLTVAPILRSSRLASVQSILLDVLLQHRTEAICANCILDCLTDSRLYHASGMGYWLEQGLIVAWPQTQSPQRAKILEIIQALLRTDGEAHNARNFLLRLPIDDLPLGLRNERPAENDSLHEPYGRPQRADVTSFEGYPIEDDDERLIGKWPEDFSWEAVKTFARSTNDLSTPNSSSDELRDKLVSAARASAVLLPKLGQREDILREPSNYWVFRNLTAFFDSYHRANDVPPDDLVRACAELSLTFLKDIPNDLPGDLPKDDVWTGYHETEWVGALKLADSVFGWPPVKNNEAVQKEFERILDRAFRTEKPLIQLICTTTVRPWHWFRSNERRQLHDQLVWNLPKHASVLTWSLGRIGNYSDANRARVFRLLMNRADVEASKLLAHRLGHYVGMYSMVVYQNGQRSVVSELAREAVNNPERFRLLEDRTYRHEFLLHFVFGMKEQAQRMSINTELSVDYGYWALKIWRMLRSHEQSRSESERVVLISLHWLEKKERKLKEIATFKSWWRNLQPLLNAVVTDGGRLDCFTLFFNLRDGEYNDLTNVEELIKLGEIFTERIRKGAQEGSMKLDEIEREQQEWNSWHEIACYLAETIDSLRRDGSLQTDLHREQAHDLLSLLASEPVRSAKAVEVLHRLQNE